MKPVARPVYLNLLRIHLPVMGWVSILHRLSGALLVVAFPLGVGWLARSLESAAAYDAAIEGVRHPLARVLLLGLVWALAHHFLAGLRHLALDVRLGSDLRQARASAVGVMLGAAIVTLAVGWRWFA